MGYQILHFIYFTLPSESGSMATFGGEKPKITKFLCIYAFSLFASLPLLYHQTTIDYATENIER